MAAKFDAYAKDYETLHANSIATSGEQPGYFADYKADCIAKLLQLRSAAPLPILDYGCGIGGLTERLCARFQNVYGFDPSDDSLKIARERCPRATFFSNWEGIPRGHFGLVILANVLHHVEPAQRAALVHRLLEFLKPESGALVVFEHNPYNPLTRRAVAQCEFDDDAILLTPKELGELLRQAGFEGVERRFIVFFPRFLAALRPFEPRMGWLPLGAQMMVTGAAPARSTFPLDRC